MRERESWKPRDGSGEQSNTIGDRRSQRIKRDTWITREESTRSKGSIKDSQRYIQFESLLNDGN